MTINLLAVGDVVSDRGVEFLTAHLRSLCKLHQADFVVVNGENAAGVGILPRQAEDIFSAGADVITLGNHTWNKQQICSYLDDSPYILRPANYAGAVPGRGYGIYDGPRGLRIAVLNLMGRLNLDSNLDSPFSVADKLLSGIDADLVCVDFHAEATSEKLALGHWLDGRVQAFWGTHTHVPTADAQVLSGGTGYVTDLGMTGPANGILGVKAEQSINLFRGGIHQRYEAADGPCKLEAVLFTVDTDARRCTGAVRVDING
ncbi:MAG: YmdB family metallophosphoesterase [Oscillospiraceae bacterium]|nr:YmdB family metallophosphoesterase [Oscillospiraceae bacterium]